MLRANEDLDQAYYIRLEPNRDRIVFRSAIMYSEQGGKTFPYEVELERPLRLLPNKPYRIRIFVDNTVCEVYVEDEIAMSARLYDLCAGAWGVFVSEGSATFDQLVGRNTALSAGAAVSIGRRSCCGAIFPPAPNSPAWRLAEDPVARLVMGSGVCVPCIT